MSVVANVAINVDSRGATQKLREVQSQAQQTERAFGGLANSVGQLVRAYAAFQAVKFVFTQAAEIQSQTRSLEVLTGSVQKATQIVRQLQDLGAVTPFTSSELIDAAKRLQAFGVETSKVVDTTRRLADVSGATGAELQGLVTAYGQVQAKGRLQGEELLQFQERGVALQKILKDEYKLSGEEFQDALENGRISAQAVEAAIIKLTDAGGKYANGAIAQSDTLNGKLSTLQDSFQRLAQNIGTFFEPVFKFLIDGVNALIERLNNASRIGAEARAYEEANRRTRTRFGALRYANPFDQEVQQYRERLRKSLVASEMGAGAAAVAPAMGAAGLPPLLGGTGGKKKTGKSDAEREAERLRKELERSLEVGDQLGTQFARQAALLFEGNEIEKKRLQIQYEYEDRARQITELKNAEQQTNLNQLNDEIRRLEIIELQTEALKKQAEEAEKLFREALAGTEFGVSGGGPIATMVDEMKRALEDFISPANQVKTAAEAIGGAFAISFQDIVTGAKTAQQAIADFFDKIGQALIDYATKAIAQYIALGIARLFAGLDPLAGANKNLSGTGALSTGKLFPTGAFAEGGFVTGPTNALIGEGGEPEYVIPASKMASAMAKYSAGASGEALLNDDGTGTSFTKSSAQYGTAQINISGGTLVFNDQNYVKADQIPAIISQSSKMGQAMAIKQLQMSATTRKKLGL